MSSLSRITLDAHKRGARKLMGNPQAMHAAVMAVFGNAPVGDEARPLWRVDSGNDGHHLYVSGPGTPNLAPLQAQAGVDGVMPVSTDLGPFLARLSQGQVWAFRLTANPVSAVSQGPGARGKVVPHVSAAQQLDWLDRKAEQHGFRVARFGSHGEESEESALSALVTQRRDLRFSKNHGGHARRVSIRTARFDGHLVVTDPDALRLALLQGIGRARAYGCGLLSLASPNRLHVD